jgi:murein DD-endopeptidase MepM/ murein hydrolase activator NlpD
VAERGAPAVAVAPDAPSIAVVDPDGAEIDDADRSFDPGDPGLRAERYDGIYAQGVPVWVAMTATRELESGGNYNAQARGSTASGAYQVIDSTWNNYGGYRRAVDAPPAVQDQFAYESMVVILKRYGNDVSSIPLAWYFPASLGNERLMDVVPVPQAGNVLTPRQYQARWMAAFNRHLEAGSPVYLPADSNPLIPAIAFPVLGPTTFWDDWHAPRDGGARRHEGLDFMGVDGQPLRAAFDGVVTRIRPDNVGLPGVGITITREDGLRANYFHLDATLRWHPHLEVGDRVKAGQVIAYMGSTGNAGIPHLHFELRTPEGEPMAPYPAVLEAIQREQCSVGIGPWSTVFASPAEIAANLAEAAEAARAAGVELADLVRLFQPDVFEVEGPDGALWKVDSFGGVTATGVGALIAPRQGGCGNVPDDVFGTNAAGLGIDLLPAEWWGDEVDPEDLAAMIAAVAQETSEEFDEPKVAIDGGDAFARMMIARRQFGLEVTGTAE